MTRQEIKLLCKKIAQDAFDLLNALEVEDAEQRSRLFFVKGGANDRVLEFPAPVKNELTEDFEEGNLKFTEKEIAKMPSSFRKVFRAQGCTAYVRRRSGGRYNCSYEIRFRGDGYNISASATTLEKAKEKFIEKIKAAVSERDNAQHIPTKFLDFAQYWFENFHARKVCDATYAYGQRIFNTYVKPSLKNIPLAKVTPVMLQSLLDGLERIPKTADEVYSLLNQIFKSAVNHGVLRLNPLGMCYHKQHERKHGSAFTKDEETRLLSAYAGEPCQLPFALMLYCGLRPNELYTVTLEGGFIKAVNSKRKGGKVEHKRIPVSPMLAPYIADAEVIDVSAFPTDRVLDIRLKKVLPNHKLYDMRTTFQTRCTECGVNETAIGVFMGNSIGKLKEAYTDLSDDFLLREGAKLKY